MKNLNKALIAATMLAGTALSTPAMAYESENVFTGFYIGAQIGYGMNEYEMSEATTPVKQDLFGDGVLGGVFFGYGYMMDRVYLGLEADFEYSDVDTKQTFGTATVKADKDWGFSVGARLGYEVVDNAIAYLRLAYNGSDYEVRYNDGAASAKKDKFLSGFELGGGAEMAMTENVTMRLDYAHTWFENMKVTTTTPTTLKTEPSENKVRLGIAYIF